MKTAQQKANNQKKIAKKNIKTKKAKQKENQSKIMKKRWEDPEGRTKLIDSITNAKNNPEYRERVSETMKEIAQRPGFKENLSKKAKERLSDPDNLRRHQQMVEDTAEQRGKKMKSNWKNPDFVYNIMKARKGHEVALKVLEERFGYEIMQNYRYKV